MLAIPLSQTPRDYLFLFRKEVIHTIDWAGNPDKHYPTGPLGDRLTPRKSFAIWKQTVERQSHPWTPADLDIAEAARTALLEVLMRHSELLSEERRKADLRHADAERRAQSPRQEHPVADQVAGLASRRARGAICRTMSASLQGRIQALSHRA